MTPYATPTDLANYLDPDAIPLPAPHVVTYPDGSTVTISRTLNMAQADIRLVTNAVKADQVIPAEFCPPGNTAVTFLNGAFATPGFMQVTMRGEIAPAHTLGFLLNQGPYPELLSFIWEPRAIVGVATPPPLATVLLRSAQALVLDAIAAAIYSVDENEHATDAKTHEAIKTAILEQASAWSLYGIDPRMGAGQAERQVASKSLLGGSVSYVADPARDTYRSELASGTYLTASAWAILRNAGLIVTTVRSGSGGIEVFNIAQRAYDPTTGVLEP